MAINDWRRNSVMGTWGWGPMPLGMNPAREVELTIDLEILNGERGEEMDGGFCYDRPEQIYSVLQRILAEVKALRKEDVKGSKGCDCESCPDRPIESIEDPEPVAKEYGKLIVYINPDIQHSFPADCFTAKSDYGIEIFDTDGKVIAEFPQPVSYRYI